MKTGITVVTIVSGWVAIATAGVAPQQPPPEGRAKTSYVLGLNLGANWKDIDVDHDWLIQGMKDAGTNGRPLLTDEEIRDVFGKFQKELMAKRQEKQRQLREQQQQLAEKNRLEGEAFLAANKLKSDVVTLPSGLQYTVLAEGSGPSPNPQDTVTVNYRGTLIDGTEFDSSKDGQPAAFVVTGVIRGWTEALTKMKVGSKWRLFIPHGLAYGPASRPGIGPNSTLIFDVELLGIQSATPPATNANILPANPPLTSDIIKVPSLEEMKKGAKIETIKADDLERLQRELQEKQQTPEKK